jgi:hypothetical protein
VKHAVEVKNDKSKQAWPFQKDPQFSRYNFRVPHWKTSQHLFSIKSPSRHQKNVIVLDYFISCLLLLHTAEKVTKGVKCFVWNGKKIEENASFSKKTTHKIKY